MTGWDAQARLDEEAAWAESPEGSHALCAHAAACDALLSRLCGGADVARPWLSEGCAECGEWEETR